MSIEDTHKKTLDLDSLCFFGSSDYLYPALDFDYKMVSFFNKLVCTSNKNNQTKAL